MTNETALRPMPAMAQRSGILLVILALVALALWLGIDSDRPTETGSAVGPQTTDELSVQVGDADRTEFAAGEREELADRQVETAVASASASVQGRCVDGNGEPLAGCRIAVTVRDAEPVVGESETNGRFEMEIAADGETDAAVEVTSPGRVSCTGTLLRPEPGQAVLLGDVVLRSAFRVKGRVVDETGLPVAEVRVLFVMLDLTSRDSDSRRVTPETMLRARSDARGEFVLPGLAWAGEWWIAAEETGALVGPRSVKLDGTSDPYHLEIVVERPDPDLAVKGRVVDVAGNPIPDVRLSVTGDGFIGRGRSRTDGTFVAFRAGPMPDRGESGLRVSATDETGMREQIAPTGMQPITWGARDVRVVMRPRAMRTVTVVDAAGQPVENYVLHAFSGRPPMLVRISRLRIRGHHPDGRSKLNGLSSGGLMLIAVPAEHACAIATFEVAADVTQGELLVSVPDATQLDVVVRQSGGEPAASTVEIIAPVTGDPLAPGPCLPLEDLDRSRGTPDHVLLARGETDESGRVTLDAPPGTWLLRITGERHVDAVQPIEVPTVGRTIEVQVERGARVAGLIGPAPDVERLRELAGDDPLAVVLETDDGEEVVIPIPPGQLRFERSGIPPGNYRAVFRHWLQVGEVYAGHMRFAVRPIEARDGESTQLDIDVAGMVPAELTGRVTVDGTPLGDVHCFLERRGEVRAKLRIGTDANGVFRASAPPGDYGFQITMAAQPGPGWILMDVPDAAWQVAAKDRREVNVDVRLRHARVRLIDANDRPIANTRVRVSATSFHLPGKLATDDQGWVEISPAPPVPFRLRVRSGDDETTVGPIDSPAPGPMQEIVVRVE